MKWTDNLLLEGDAPEMRTRGQLQLSLYALHLSSGHNIYCGRIKSNTVEQYVFAASLFLSQATGVDMRKDLDSDTKMGHILSPVYRELRRFESIPDRREPYDTKMHTLARKVGKSSPPLGVIASLTDWFEQGLLAGYRLSEFAQPSKRTNPLYPEIHLNPSIDVKTRAFVPNDIRVLTSGSRSAVGLDVLRYPVDTITKMWVKYRVQKNNQNGEERAYAPNSAPDGYCFIHSMYRILTRYRDISRLDQRVSPAVTPLGLYWDPSAQQARLITSTNIESYMRWLAAQVYHLDSSTDKDQLSKWGAHSLRVGACVLLHAMGFSPIDIKWLLRWKSDAFMDYLRNVLLLSRRQNMALDKAATMPHVV